MDSFWENRKKSKNGCFLATFGLILAMFLTSMPYDFDAFAHAGAPLGEKWLCKISWKSYGQFLRNLKFSWKGREKKKQHDCISSRKFFPTPKKCFLVVRERLFLGLQVIVSNNFVQFQIVYNCSGSFLVQKVRDKELTGHHKPLFPHPEETPLDREFCY